MNGGSTCFLCSLLDMVATRYYSLMRFPYFHPSFTQAMVTYVMLCAILLTVRLTCISSRSSIYYASFLSPITTTADDSVTFVKKFDLVLQSDDSIFGLVPLDWKFVFFGRTFDTVFVSPNGAIHADVGLPCGTFPRFPNVLHHIP